MIHLNVLLTVKDPANIERVKTLLAETATRSRPEAGCERFEIYHSQADTRVFLLVEWWTSQAHLDAHRQGVNFTQFYTPNVLPLVERQPHLCDRIA
jgi:quinol monooxygenase YgiN